MRKLNKLVVFKDVKDLGQRWMSGDHEEVIASLTALKTHKGTLYGVLTHRYIVKTLSEQHGPEKGFSMASDFATGLLRAVAE
jgi:hypothetical protein